MTTTDRRTASLVKTSSFSAILLIAGKFLNLLAIFGLSFVMSLSAFGEFMYARGVLLFLAPFMSLGLSVTAMRRIPGFLEEGRPGDAHGYLKVITRVAFISALVVAALVAFAGFSLANEGRATTLALAMIGLVGAALLVAQTQAARAFGHVLISYGPLNVLQPLLLAITALFIWATSGPPEQNAVALALAVTILIAAAVQYLLLRRDPDITSAPATTRPSAWIKESAPFTISMAAQGIVASAPLLILGFSAQSATLGIFGFFQALMQGLTIFNTSVFGAANPKLSAHLAGGRIPAAKNLLMRSRIMATGVTLFGVLVGMVAIHFLAPLVKPEFGSAPMTLLILLLSVAINSTSGPLGHVLIIHDKRFWEVSAQIAAAATTLVLCFILIPTLGIIGAALATLAASIMRTVILHVLVFGVLKFGRKEREV